MARPLTPFKLLNFIYTTIDTIDSYDTTYYDIYTYCLSRLPASSAGLLEVGFSWITSFSSVELCKASVILHNSVYSF